MTRYLKLFSVICNHGYYARGYSPDFTFVPTPDCQKLMRNFGLLPKSQPGGFQVFYTAKEHVPSVLEMEKKPVTFSFFIQNRNPLFSNLTDIALQGSSDANNQAYHFQNREVTGTEESLPLQQGEQVSESNRYPLRPMAFEYEWEPSGQPKKIEVKNQEGEGVCSLELPDEKLNSTLINLRHEVPGKYSLWLDGKEVESFLAADINPMDCFGLLQVHFGDTAAKGYELIKNGKITPKDYSLDFAARATFWKYFFIIKNKSQYGVPEIYKGKKEAAFVKAEEVTLSDGAQAYMLKSKEQLQLRQIPQESFRLRLPPADGSNPLSMALPGPSLGQLKPELEGNQLVFNSEIFVYV
jgi:hypothetical protein